MASTSAQPDLEAQSSRQQEKEKQPEHVQEQEQQQQQQSDPRQDTPQEMRQRDAPVPVLPPSHQKVRFQRESQIIPPSAPPPQAYAQYVQQDPVVYPFSPSWHRAKLAFYTFGCVVSLILIALSIYVTSTTSYIALAQLAFVASFVGSIPSRLR